MLRKQLLRDLPVPRQPDADEIPVASAGLVLVTSETPDHPVEHLFDQNRGPGGTRWVAQTPGEQTLILAFDDRQPLKEIALEVEEREVARTQELEISISSDGGATYRQLVRQEYNFSPPGTTFESERWPIPPTPVTHLKLRIRPDKSGGPCVATMTSLVLR